MCIRDRNEIKEMKYQMYKLAWYMRGSFSYEDVMFRISAEDKEILSTVINENIENTTKTQLPLI